VYLAVFSKVGVVNVVMLSIVQPWSSSTTLPNLSSQHDFFLQTPTFTHCMTKNDSLLFGVPDCPVIRFNPSLNSAANAEYGKKLSERDGSGRGMEDKGEMKVEE